MLICKQKAGFEMLFPVLMKGCLAKLAKDLELDAVTVSCQFKPYLAAGCVCTVVVLGTLVPLWCELRCCSQIFLFFKACLY